MKTSSFLEGFACRQMDHGFADLLANASQKLAKTLSNHPQRNEILSRMTAIEPRSGLPMGDLLLLIIGLRAKKAINPLKTVNSAITTKKLADWLKTPDCHIWPPETYYPCIGESRHRMIRPGEIVFQWRETYYVSATQRWIRPSQKVEITDNFGQNIGEQLALKIEKHLNLSQDEGDWLANDFRQAKLPTYGKGLRYTGTIRGMVFEIFLPIHEGEKPDLLLEQVPNVVEPMLSAISEQDRIRAAIAEELAGETGQVIKTLQIITRVEIKANETSCTLQGSMDEVTSNFDVRPNVGYHLVHYKTKINDAVISQTRDRLQTVMLPAARGSQKNLDIKIRRQHETYALKPCVITQEILTRIDKWDNAIGERIRNGFLKHVKVPNQYLDGIVAQNAKGGQTKINFHYQAGRMLCSLRLNEQYQWKRNAVYGFQKLAETVQRGMIGMAASQVLDHPFAQKLGPVSSIANYGDKSSVKFHLAKR